MAYYAHVWLSFFARDIFWISARSSAPPLGGTESVASLSEAASHAEPTRVCVCLPLAGTDHGAAWDAQHRRHALRVRGSTQSHAPPSPEASLTLGTLHAVVAGDAWSGPSALSNAGLRSGEYEKFGVQQLLREERLKYFAWECEGCISYEKSYSAGRIIDLNSRMKNIWYEKFTVAFLCFCWIVELGVWHMLRWDFRFSFTV